MRRVFYHSFLGLFFLFSGCSPSSSEDFHREGKARCKELIQVLGKIENREQLLAAEPQLKTHFESLITLMIDAREFEQRHLDEEAEEEVVVDSGLDAKLEEELRRVYAIEGGREVIERSQHEALIRLDAYERTLAKKKEQLKNLYR